MLQHLIDAERISTYRALRIARNDRTALPGWDENLYAPASEAENVDWGELVTEFARVREATIPLFRHIPAAAWARTGTANNVTFSVRALAWITIGHVEHHVSLIRERYL